VALFFGYVDCAICTRQRVSWGHISGIQEVFMTYTFTRHDIDDDAVALKLVDHGIGEYNDAAEPRLADVRHLSCFARDAQGRAVAGAVGRTWGNNVELQQIWLPESERKHGLGSALLREFEAAALARHCRFAYLETWTFQAREFYEKSGYKVVLEISGFADSLSKFTMTKQLVR
jgi:GNAT superfamily N-acetyltransferase